jgi:circadian clock protein KaiC
MTQEQAAPEPEGAGKTILGVQLLLGGAQK